MCFRLGHRYSTWSVSEHSRRGFFGSCAFVVSVLLFLSFPSFQTFVTCKHRQLRHAQALPRYRYVSALQSLKSVFQTFSL